MKTLTTTKMAPVFAVVSICFLAFIAGCSGESGIAESERAASPQAAGSEPGTDQGANESSTELSLRMMPIDGQATVTQAEISNLIVRKSALLPEYQVAFHFDPNGSAKVPFFADNSMILKLRDDLSRGEIADLLDKYQLRMAAAFPEIKSIHVRTDLSGYFKPQIGDDSVNDQYLRGLLLASKELTADDRILVAAPDLVMESQNYPVLTPMNITNSSSESTDWGVFDIQADSLWSMPSAKDGVVFGVLDAGFARHEDIIFANWPADTLRSDHGNHVSGIACAQHENGRGTQGVLPNCFVAPRANGLYAYPDKASDITSFYRIFSQIIADMNRVMAEENSVTTYNVSLGYNWMPNFGINPDKSSSAEVRALVEAQGEVMISILELAEWNGKVVYSAAGNDSHGLADPIDAKYASAFNWAAITARDRGLSRSGIVVEAHDHNGDRASFSNEGGHISCPGIGIRSAVAHDANGNPSEDSYGEMSGTSMASPYCAAAHQLFSLVRPVYSNVDVADCLLNSQTDSNSGAPLLRLEDALQACQ